MLFVCLFVSSLPFSAEDSAHVQDHFTLLERQIIIEVRDTKPVPAGSSVESLLQHSCQIFILTNNVLIVFFSQKMIKNINLTVSEFKTLLFSVL